MTDERPRPQYGEYATPEEQITAGGLPVAATGAAAQPANEPASKPAAARSTARLTSRPTSRGLDSAPPSAPNPAPNSAPNSAPNPASPPAVRRPLDLSLTVLLLSLNAYMVLTSIPDWLNLGATLVNGYTQLGYGDYTSIPLANSIGLGIVAVQVVLLVAVLYLAIRRLRSQRRGLPIAFGLGLLTIVLTMVLLMVAMTSDPALAAYIATQNGN